MRIIYDSKPKLNEVIYIKSERERERESPMYMLILAIK